MPQMKVVPCIPRAKSKLAHAINDVHREIGGLPECSLRQTPESDYFDYSDSVDFMIALGSDEFVQELGPHHVGYSFAFDTKEEIQVAVGLTVQILQSLGFQERVHISPFPSAPKEVTFVMINGEQHFFIFGPKGK